jgi:hypothetical protein
MMMPVVVDDHDHATLLCASSSVTSLCREGIPSHLRGEVWQALLGRCRNPSSFLFLLRVMCCLAQPLESAGVRDGGQNVQVVSRACDADDDEPTPHPSSPSSSPSLHPSSPSFPHTPHPSHPSSPPLTRCTVTYFAGTSSKSTPSRRPSLKFTRTLAERFRSIIGDNPPSRGLLPSVADVL